MYSGKIGLFNGALRQFDVKWSWMIDDTELQAALKQGFTMFFWDFL